MNSSNYYANYSLKVDSRHRSVNVPACQVGDDQSHAYAFASQKGFTLLELMIAMAIFAMLAVAGWQIFDSISRSKERAELQTDVLTELQYGYQQIQRDMAQVVAYQIPNNDSSSTSLSNNNLNNNSNDAVTANLANGFSLQSNQLSFIRFADPDPRYLQSHSLERIVYTFNDGNLIRQRYTTLDDSSNERPLTSVIIEGANAGQWQVLLPDPASVYPDTDDTISQLNSNAGLNSENDSIEQLQSTAGTAKLPLGVSVNFTIALGSVDTPISWVYALSKVAPVPESSTPKIPNRNSGSDKDKNKDKDDSGSSPKTDINSDR